MDNDQHMNTDMSTISENNLGGILFPDYGTGNLILTSDIGNSLSSFEGTLCFDETNNELVYVNMPVQMISSGMHSSDSLPNSNSVFSSFGSSMPSLSDLPLFSDGGQVMLLTGSSIVIPNDEDNLISSNSDPFILERVLNSSKSDEKVTDSKLLNLPRSTGIVEDESKQSNNHLTLLNENDKNDRNMGTKEKETKKEVKHVCKLCVETFHSLRDYRKHLLKHKDHKMHQCKCCEASFNKFTNLILHEVNHTNETKCPLLNCQKKFNRKASLKAHVKLHEEDESLTCSECGEEFRNQMYLELHYKYQSQCRVSTTEPAASKNKTFLCKLCNRNFDSADVFSVHKKEHDKLKKALATKSHKKKSAPSVPNSRINRCTKCAKWFLKPSQLVRHMRIHTGERPFVCNVCNKAFNQANSLKIHMLKHTGDRPFQCPFCLTSFSQRGNLRQHINRVHSIPKVEENVYKCSECPCIFKKMCSLNAHKNRAHQQRYLNEESSSNDNEDVHDPVETAITIESGVDDVNDEDVDDLLNKDSTITVMNVQIPDGKGAFCTQKVLVKMKNNTRYYICSHCPKQNPKLKEIIRHLRQCVLGKSFKCEYCSKMFSQQSTFLTHLTLHATAKTYQCAHCDRSFSNPAELEIHSKSHMVMFDQQMCISCLKTFPAHELENHPCVPLICDYEENISLEEPTGKSSIADVVKVHDTINLILPPYDCNRCNTSFESYTKLKQHLHSAHDAVICEPCCLQFFDKDKFEEHVSGHHEKEISDLICSECGKRFPSKSKRDAHYKTHFKTRKKKAKYECCGKTFKDELSLGKHAKKFHKRDDVPEPLSNIDDNDFGVTVGENCDIDLVNGLDGLNPFNSGDVYVPCSTTSIHSDIIDKATENIPNGNDFSIRHDVRHFTSGGDTIAHSSGGDFDVNNESVFVESQICVNENVENSVNLESDVLKTELLATASSNLPSQVLNLDSIADNLFDFPSSVIPVEVCSADDVASNGILNAVVYKNAKSYQQCFSDLDLQKPLQDSECNEGESSICDSYFYACNTCYLTFKNLPTLLRHLQTHDGSKSFECLYCGVENKTQAQLTHHIAQHSLNKEFPCVHCGDFFDSLEVVKKHITDIHLMSSVDKKSEQKRKKNSSSELLLSEKEKIIIARQKPHKYSSISEKVLSSLLKNNADKNSKTIPLSDKEDKSPSKKKKNEVRKLRKENVCSYCSRGFKKMCDLVRHIRIHTGEKPFKCDYCNKCFTVKSILNCHLKTHFSVNNIFCHICNRFFATVGSLKTHMRLHTGERPYKCLYCKETFRTSGHRDSHQKRHKVKTKPLAAETSLIEIEDNELELNLESVVNVQEEYIIPEMNVSENFKFQDIDLTDLSNLPSNRRTNSCAVCRKVFKKKSDLDRHMNIHIDEKGYECMLCDQKFNQLNTFKTHLKKHSNDQSFACDKCDNTFASSKNLKIHKIRHHPDSLNLPIKDGVEKRNQEIIETNKDISKWCISAEIFDDKAADMKKYDNVSDFYIIDKPFDLNSMMQDLFPDDEK